MNVGNLPGYYFDDEKQKYFRIQQDHKLPASTHYSFSSVQKDKRNAKRQKKQVRELEKKKQSRIATLTTTQHASTSLLMRESGCHYGPRIAEDIDHSLVANLAFSRSHIIEPLSGVPVDKEIYSATALKHLDATLVQTNRRLTLFPLEQHERQRNFVLSDSLRSWPCISGTRVLFQQLDTDPTCMFDFEFKHLTLEWRTLVLGAETMSLQPQKFRAHNPLKPQPHDHLYPCDIAWSSVSGVAIGSSVGLLHLNTDFQCTFTETEKEYQRVDWLDSNLIIAASRKTVALYDIRNGKGAIRFGHGKRITGVKGIKDSNGRQMLVSDNHGLKLYDLRMTSKDRDRYPLAFSGVHAGPKAQFDVMQNLVATLMDEQVQVLSLRTGRTLRTLDTPRRYTHSRWAVLSEDFRGPTWHDNGQDSPYIQMCASNEIWRWSTNNDTNDL